MAADLLLTAAEEGKFENKLAEAIEEPTFFNPVSIDACRSYAGPPGDASWFMNPWNILFTSTIHHSFWSYKPT